MKATMTHEAEILNLLRDKAAISNKELEKFGKGYRMYIQMLRRKGIPIENYKVNNRVASKEGTIYVLDPMKDNEFVEVIYDHGTYRVRVCKPLQVTEVENGVARAYEIGRSERSLWSGLVEWFNMV